MKLLGLNTLFLRGISGQWRGSTSPLALFAGGVIGVWFDPSDRTTLFEDVAGTIPATLPGQPVGLMLDKSKGLVLGPELVTNGDFSTPDLSLITANAGNTVSIVNGRLRITRDGSATTYGGGFINISGLVSGRYYQLVISCISGTLKAVHRARLNQFQSAYYGENRASGTYVFNSAGSTLMIDFASSENKNSGFFEFDNISVRELPGYHATQSVAASRPTLARHPKGGRRNLLNATDVLATQTVTLTAVAHTLSFTGTGSVTLSGAATGSLVGTGVGNRVSVSFTPTAGPVTFTVSGSVTLAQVEAGGLTNYQRVVSQYDVTEAGVPDCWGLMFDGVDDFLVTPAIDLTGTDKVGVFAGVRKLSDAAAGIIAELSAITTSSAGSFYFASGDGLRLWSSLARGTASAVSTQNASAPGPAPDTAVLSITHDISGDLSRMRRNGVVGTDAVGDKGAGNFGNYPLYIGRRGGTSLPFNGLLYGLIVPGKLPSAAEITNTETFLNSKMGAF